MKPIGCFNVLALIGIIAALLTVYKKRNITETSTWLIFYLLATAITWLGEFIVLGLFDSYAYKPGLFQNPWAENLTGHLILNSTLWPGTALLVAGYRLKFRGILVITAGFLVLEVLFLRMDLYEHHWWRYFMTALAICFYLVLLKLWFLLMNRKRYGTVRFISLYLASFVILHLPTPLLLLYGKQYYAFGLPCDTVRASVIFILLYQLLETLIILFFLSRKTWVGNLVPYILSMTGQIYLASQNILIIQEDWKLGYTLLLYALTLTLCLLMEKYTLKAKNDG